MRRITALILTIVMCLSLLPAQVVFGVDTEGAIVYKTQANAFYLDKMYAYNSAPTGGWHVITDGNRQGSMITNFDLVHWDATVNKDVDGKIVEPFKIMNADATELWSVEVPVLAGWAEYWLQQDYLWVTLNPDYYGEDSSSRGYVALRLKIPTAGKYDIELSTLRTHNQSALTEVYFGPAKKEKYLASEIDGLLASSDFRRLGTYRSDKASAYIGGIKAIEEYEDYLLIFNVSEELLAQAPAVTTANTQQFFLSEIRLTPVDEIARVTVFEEDTIPADTYAEAKVRAYNAEGEPIDISSAEAIYKTSDKKIADIDEKTGEIYAINPGTVTISAEFEAYNNKYTAKKEIQVTAETVATEIPETLNFRFPFGFVNVGESDRLKVTDENGNYPGAGIKYEYKISKEDANIIKEENGLFTGISIGSADVEITATLGQDEKKFNVKLAVAGKNMFTRFGVKHGEFERGVFFNIRASLRNAVNAGLLPQEVIDELGTVKEKETYWRATRDAERDIYRFSHNKDVVSEITGRKTNTITATVDDTPATEGNGTARIFRIGDTYSYFSDTGSAHNGAINLEKGKLYEYTVFAKIDNAKTMPQAKAQLSFQSINGTAVSYAGSQLNYEPWAGLTGNQPWTQFSSDAVYVNWDSPRAVTPLFQLSTTVSDDREDYYEVSVAHLSFHEVLFEGVDFALKNSMDGAKTYSTYETTVTPYSNTGKKIVAGSESNPYTVKYTTSDPVVAKVDDNGVITAISDGECDITAEVDINGVKQTGVIHVTLSGLEVMFESIKSSAPEVLSVGDTAQIETVAYNTNATVCEDEIALYYETSDYSVASVGTDGTITAKAPGVVDITVYAKSGSVRATDVITVTVSDSTPLASAEIKGARTIERGFETKLEVAAKHESGLEANIEACEVKFSLAPDADESIADISDDGTVTAKNVGKTYVVAEVSCNGSTVVTEPFEIEVTEQEPKDVYIDFRTGVTGTSALEATIDAFGYRINRDKTSKTVIDKVLSGADIKSCYYAVTALVVRIASIADSREADTVVDFVVDYDGWYRPSFMGMKDKQGADTHLYINDGYIGDYVMGAQNAQTSAGVMQPMNPVYLKAGEINHFTVRSYAYGPGSTAWQNLSELSLEYLGNEPQLLSAKLTAEKTSLVTGESLETAVKGEMSDGGEYLFGLNHGYVKNDNAYYVLESSDTEVVEISEDGMSATAKNPGTATVSAVAYYNGIRYDAESVLVTVFPTSFASINATMASQVMKPNEEGHKITVTAYDSLGSSVSTEDAEIYFFSDNTDAVAVSGDGFVSPVAIGQANVTVSVTINGVTQTTSLAVSVREGKTGSTYYTADRVSAARENVGKYDWARAAQKSAVAEADKYLPLVDTLYDFIHSNDVPRSTYLGSLDNPYVRYCRYCKVDMWAEHGRYAWTTDPLSRPWKIQCPDCKRLFPSNDFESFYNNGIDEHGKFNRTFALEENGILCGRGERVDGVYVVKPEYADNPYGYGDPKGNLYNELYSELRDPSKPEYNTDPFYGDKITQGWISEEAAEKQGVGYFWGVDDGWGYDTGRVFADQAVPVKDNHAYIGYFSAYGLWEVRVTGHNDLITNAIRNFRDAYLYTGEKKYAIAGAKLIDRIADMYPEYDCRPYYYTHRAAHHGQYPGAGKIIGQIWEYKLVVEFATAYDAFFPIFDAPEVVEYLSEKARLFNNTEINDKSSGEKIRQNIEKNFLEEVFVAVQDTSICGNFGFYQNALAHAAVVLDTYPQTGNMIEWLMKEGEYSVAGQRITGGSLLTQIVDVVDRDGYGNENSWGYNSIWITETFDVAKALAYYEDAPEGTNLFEQAKFLKMIEGGSHTIVQGGATQANISDHGNTLTKFLEFDTDALLEAYVQTRNPRFAQILYFANGSSAEGIRGDIFTKNPEDLADEIEAVIEKYGEFDTSKSSITTGYGFAALRAGTKFTTSDSNVIDNTTRDFWIYFGTGPKHKHTDMLNLGINAFGMDMAPEFGYPAEMQGPGAKKRTQFDSQTISHNTVVVNDEAQYAAKKGGTPLHFDDSGDIQVMDIDAPDAYINYTDTYRRTIVSVDVDDTVSYALDFFRIVGGDEHLYTFHSQSVKTDITGVTLIPQTMGTYAGPDVEYGDTTSYKREDGYNWLYNVERAQNPKTGTFMADFDIDKLRPTMKGVKERDWHLRLTMHNDFDITEVALADGRPPVLKNNPDHFDYLLVRRSGKNLDTLFTTVIEPYIGQSAIESTERVSVTRTDGKPMRGNEPVAAVKVTLKDGRVDYVVYAANNAVTYNIGGVFDFCGFVGVYSLDGDGVPVRRYLLDGTYIGNPEKGKVTKTDYAALAGNVLSFTEGLPKGEVNPETGATEYNSFINIKLDENTLPDEVEVAGLRGNLINIDNDGLQNGTYAIESAELSDDGVLTVGIGNVSLVRQFVDPLQREKGVIHNIEKGQSAKIPVTTYETDAPYIEPVTDVTVSAGSTVTIPITATSVRGKAVTLSGTVLPRGMSINKETGVLTWKPDDSQVGENHVAITASDGALTTTLRFNVMVYGRTTGSGEKTDSSVNENTDAPTGGGGGGGGGGGAAPTPDTETTTDDTENTDETDNNQNDGEKAPDASGETENLRFTDLSNHAWAENAINALAESGIIKGTSASTFSPASNITRADFALLLVRAFDLSSDNTENFADVSATDYFAPELAVARNTGIVNGIGDNKYAPRNTITRQDMMVIVYRALTSLGVEFGIYDEPQHPDFDTVADYAREAVSALISAGLANGKNAKIAPADFTTRAEVAVLIKRILEYLK